MKDLILRFRIAYATVSAFLGFLIRYGNALR